MTRSPGGHELSNRDPLAQNSMLRQTINCLPKRRTFGLSETLTDEEKADEKAQLYGTMGRTEKGDRQEYRVVLREQFAARLAESYATPSLQKYALMLFEDVYNRGLTRDAMVPLGNQKTPSSRSEHALLVL